MENFVVSARKYRPMSFKDVVGQSSLTNTLKQAITRNKLASAYLFCGPRGVGKTTCARIFAKAINCLDFSLEGEPCNVCDSCRSFNEQRSLNIQELNAAANNSVTDIREIIDQVRIPPQHGRYKVIILDEVHMLSPSASNALLKTLEEPPSYVIFILATTEKHKILPTILSRCQIFDFNRMEIDNIIEELKMVASKEGVVYEENALNMIAQKADGGMRDALSIFDQVTNFSGGNITYESVLSCLNYLDYEYYFTITDYLLEHRVAAALLLLGEVISKGFDAGNFIGGLASHLRDLLVSRDACTLPLLDVAASVKEKYGKQAQLCTLNFLYKAIKICDQCSNAYKSSFNKRLSVEIALIETAQLETDNTLEEKKNNTSAMKPVTVGAVQASSTPGPVSQSQAKVVPHTTAVPATSANPAQAASSTAHAVPATPPIARNATAAHSTIGAIPRINTGRTKTFSTPVVPAVQSQLAGTSVAQGTQAAAKVQPLTRQAVKYYWDMCAQNISYGDMALSARMKNADISVQGESGVLVTVPNEMVKSVIREKQLDIESYLRKSLNNVHVSLTFEVRITESQLLRNNPQQLLEKMVETNPNLGKLRDNLHLVLD